MKTKKCFSLAVLMIVAVSVFAGDGKSSFSGVWKLNKEKSPPANSQIFLSKISFTIKNDSLFTVRTYENTNGEIYPFNENLTMDGKEYKIVIYDMPRKAKAHWSEQGNSLVIESTTTFRRDSGDEDFSSTETWNTVENGTQLTFDYIAKLSSGESKGTYYFIKSE